MELDAKDVIRHFMFFSDMEFDESVKWIPLCKAVTAEFSSKLKKKLDKDQADRVAMAAAACAYHKYTLMMFAAGPQKIGDVTLSGSGAVASAKEMAQEFLGGVADLVETGPVAFLSV